MIQRLIIVLSTLFVMLVFAVCFRQYIFKPSEIQKELNKPLTSKTPKKADAKPIEPIARGLVRYAPTTVKAPDLKTAQKVLSQMSRSDIWKKAVDLSRQRAMPGSKPPVFKINVLQKKVEDSLRFTLEMQAIDPESEKSILIPLQNSKDNTYVFEGEALQAITTEAGLNFLLQDDANPWQVEDHLLKWIKKAEGESKEKIRIYLARLGKFGYFDASLAGMDVPLEAADKILWKGNDYLVKAGQKVLKEEPLWSLVFLLSSQPKRIRIESEVGVTPLKPKKNQRIIPGMYKPGLATVKVIMEGSSSWPYCDTIKHKTPSMVRGVQSPYELAEIGGVCENLRKAGLHHYKFLSPELQVEHFPFLVASIGHAQRREEFQEELVETAVHLARKNKKCQQVLVYALASRIHRLDHQCRKIFKTLGPACIHALVYGLSHPFERVRSQCARILSTDVKDWTGHLEEEIVDRCLDTLEDTRFYGAYSQILYLLRDLGPKARKALPVVQEIADKTRSSGARRAARAAERAILKNY